ncbi:MAG: hypothetical protein KJT03_00205 [Verrucomicrobiae bacterium]|nr:hypothetical protein [Verrucomicrobiae bacterium]
MILTRTEPVQSLTALINSHREYAGPHVSLAMNTPGGGVEFRMHFQRLKNKLRALTQTRDLEHKYAETLEAMSDKSIGLMDDRSLWRGDYGAICLYAGPQAVELHTLAGPIPEEYSFAGKHFLYRALFTAVESKFDGYAFQLSLKQPRIFKVTGNRVEELRKTDLPGDIYDLTDTDAIDGGQHAHIRQSRIKLAPAIVAQGVDSNESTRENNFPAFMRQVIHALHKLDLNPNKPIACIADPKVLGHFTDAYSGPNVVYGVTDAKNPLNEKDVEEICSRIGTIAHETRKKVMLRKFEGGDLPAQLINENLKEIYEGACQGRIDQCLISESAFAWCEYDQETATMNSVNEHTKGHDCMEVYDRILVETLEKDGEVQMLPPEKMPAGKSALAILRW